MDIGYRMKKEKFLYSGKPLEVVDNIGYLGFTFNWNGKWSEHIKKVVTKAGRGV